MGESKQPASIGDILATAENRDYVRVATARILLRQDLHARHEQLDADLTTAIEHDRTTNEDPAAPAIAAAIAELETEIETAKVEFRFRAVSQRAWADLMKAHPPLKGERDLDHNPDTFWPAAIAACCAEPEMNEDDAKRLANALSPAQWELLKLKCRDANLGGLTDPKSQVAGLIARRNGDSAEQPTTIGSPAARS